MHSAICLLALLLCGCDSGEGKPVKGVEASGKLEFEQIVEMPDGVKVYTFQYNGHRVFMAVKGDSVSLTSQ